MLRSFGRVKGGLKEEAKKSALEAQEEHVTKIYLTGMYNVCYNCIGGDFQWSLSQLIRSRPSSRN